MSGPPYLVTRHTRAAQAAKHWAAQYKIGTEKVPVFTAFSDSDRTNRLETHRLLVELGTNPDPDAVVAIIGNITWTNVKCDQCGRDVDAVVVVGAPLGYESPTSEIFLPCIEAARAVFGE